MTILCNETSSDGRIAYCVHFSWLTAKWNTRQLPRIFKTSFIQATRTKYLSLRCAYIRMLIAQNPDIDPSENVVNIPIRSSQESMTPTLENRKDFKVVVHHRTQAAGTGILRNKAILVEFTSPMSPKVNPEPGY
jgi:hypothetical protein